MMKKVLKLMSVLLALAIFSGMGASAAVEGTYAAKSEFTQSFQNLTELPEGWSHQLGGANNPELKFDLDISNADTNYLGITANGSLNLRKTDVYTAQNETYSVTFDIGKPGQNNIYMYVGVDNLTDISASGGASSSGYTINYKHATTNTITIYKDGTQIGDVMNSTFSSLPNNARVVFTVNKDNVVFAMMSKDKDETMTQTIADTSPDYTGYIGIALSSVNCNNAYVASISATDGYNGIYENHLFNYVVDENYTATDLANDGFTFTGAKTDYATPIYSYIKTSTDTTETNGIYICIRDDGTDVRRYGGTLMHDTVLSKDYEIDYVAYFGMNFLDVYINRTDAQNGYVLKYGDKIDGTNDGCILNKYSGSSTATPILPTTVTKNGEVYEGNLTTSAPIFTYATNINNISVKNEEGKLVITATLYKDNDEYVYTFEDASSPITSGKFGISSGGTGTTYVNNIKIASGSIDEVIKQTFEKGSVATLEIPAMLKGDIKVLSGIYTSNNRMVGATTKDISAFANSAKVEMFAASETTDADKMKTFIWSGLESLFPLTKAADSSASAN